jgi:uncharacterized membrane protein YeaQ/YmgE (transglycosylase-associated protein family)
MLEALVFWIIIGGIAGWLASNVVRGAGLGIGGNVIVGIIGAIIGGFIFNLMGASGVGGFNLWSVFVAFIGAVVLLFIARLVTGRGASI